MGLQKYFKLLVTFLLMQNKYLKKGFSLVEIMIVIAIIGILGGLGWVAYSRTLAASRNAQRRDAARAIQLGIVELYNATQKAVDTIYFRTEGALIRTSTSTITEVDTCVPQSGCIFVPLKDPAVPALTANLGVGKDSVYLTSKKTETGTAQFLFRTQGIADGYLLGVCLEDGTSYELSTSITKSLKTGATMIPCTS